MNMLINPSRFGNGGGGGNVLEDWFAGGGAGIWLDARYHAWSDAGGTTAAGVGDPCLLVNGKEGLHSVAASSSATAPVMANDATLARNYLQFTAGSSQKLVVNAGTTADWAGLSNGSEFLVVAKVQFGNTSDPNALYPLLSTGRGTDAAAGTDLFYDDRASVSEENNARLLISNGLSSGMVISASSNNTTTPNVVHMLSATYTAATPNATEFVDGASVASASNGGVPTSSAPTYMLTFGAFGNGAFYATMRLYAVAVLMGSGAAALRADVEAAL